MAAARALGIVSLLGLNAVLARILTKQEFGSWLGLFNLILFGGVLGMCGMNRTLVRFLAERLEDRDTQGVHDVLRMTTRIVSVSLPLTLVGFALLLTVWGERILHAQPTVTFVALSLATLALIALQLLIAEAFRGFHDLKHASLYCGFSGNPIANTVLLIVLLPFARTGSMSLNTVLTIAVAILGIVCAFSAWHLRSQISQVTGRSLSDFSPADRQPTQGVSRQLLLGTSLTLMFVQFMALGNGHADMWLAGWYCDTNEMSQFNAAKRLVVSLALPLQLVNLTVMSSIPALHSQGRREELSHLVRRAALVTAVVAPLLLVPLILFPEDTLSLAFGPEYAAGAVVLMVLAGGQLINLMTGLCGQSLNMTGHENLSAVVHTTACLVLLVGGAWATQRYGSLGLAVCSSVVMAGTNVVLWILARLRLGIWTHPYLSRADLTLFTRGEGV